MQRLAAWHSPVFLLNSCLDLFSAPRFLNEGPFSRSYGANLPSSLTVNLSSASVFSTWPPVSVFGTGPGLIKRLSLTFLGSLLRYGYHFGRSLCVLSGFTIRLLPFNVLFRQHARLSLLRHQRGSQTGGNGIFTVCPSHTPRGFCLGPGLP